MCAVFLLNRTVSLCAFLVIPTSGGDKDDFYTSCWLRLFLDFLWLQYVLFYVGILWIKHESKVEKIQYLFMRKIPRGDKSHL